LDAVVYFGNNRLIIQYVFYTIWDQAQEDAELLRSVVEPLEEEIESLKNQLRQAQGQTTQVS